MKCYYCIFFGESDIRNGNGQRFCKARAGMVSSDDETCEKFDLNSTYRCRTSFFDTGLAICVNRLNKASEECKHCKQRKDILELRRFVGRKAIQSQRQQVTEPQPKRIIRRGLCEKAETL